MFLQQSRIDEAFATFQANKRSFSGVFSFVNGQLPFADKRCRAVATFVRPLPGVTGHFVPSTVADAGVPLLTTFRTTFERFLTGVRSFVLVQRLAGLGFMRTVAAAEGGLRMAMPDMAFEVLAASKLFATFHALILLRGMTLHVRVEDGCGGEAFVTDCAREGTHAGVTEFVGR